jgi:hypothetical protein
VGEPESVQALVLEGGTENEADTVRLPVEEAQSEARVLPLTEGVRVAQPVALLLAEPRAVAVSVGDAEAVAVTLRLPWALLLLTALPLAVALPVAAPLALAVELPLVTPLLPAL